MSRIRSSLVLLGICVVAVLIGTLQLATQCAPLPTGSSYSADPTGTQALFVWADVVGASPRRLQDAPIPEDQANTTMLIVQPENALSASARDRLDAVPRQGGTLVVAGDSLPWVLYARSLGVVVDSVSPGPALISTPDGALRFTALVRYQLRANGAEQLLVAADGGSVAVRMPYKQGTLVVLATPEPLLNATLRDTADAKFVFREILSPSLARGLSFDESQHSYAPSGTAGAPITLEDLLLTTPLGRAIIYAAVLAFVYLLLSGRRLGPPLPARPPTETRRTMFEHVQMLANLYRRAGQLAVVRATFSRHYGRVLARAGGGSPGRRRALAQALARIEAARTETDLVEAVGAAVDAR